MDTGLSTISTSSLLKRIRTGDLEQIYPSLYGAVYDTDGQNRRFSALVERHITLFGESRDSRIYSTPGRTELGGNHTDHNHGHVLAASINLDTIAVASPSDDMIAVLDSEGFDPVIVDLSSLEMQQDEAGTTAALLRGIAARMAASGCHIRGFRANTSTQVLKGSGLSSSAAIEILIGTILNDLYHDGSYSPVELAILAGYAENTYFGKPSGLMDQIACAYGGIVGIDFNDMEHPAIDALTCDIQREGYTLMVVDTGGDHAALTPEYAAIPTEMRAVAQALGKETCRELDMEVLVTAAAHLRKTVGDRAVLRAYHFLQEDTRVVAMIRALKNRQFDRYLNLVKESGDSSAKYLQNLYLSSSPFEQGIPLALAITEEFLGDQGACRVHGGGFAGTIQAYIPNDLTADYITRMESLFGKGTVTRLAIRRIPAARIM